MHCSAVVQWRRMKLMRLGCGAGAQNEADELRSCLLELSSQLTTQASLPSGSAQAPSMPVSIPLSGDTLSSFSPSSLGASPALHHNVYNQIPGPGSARIPFSSTGMMRAPTPPLSASSVMTRIPTPPLHASPTVHTPTLTPFTSPAAALLSNTSAPTATQQQASRRRLHFGGPSQIKTQASHDGPIAMSPAPALLHCPASWSHLGQVSQSPNSSPTPPSLVAHMSDRRKTPSPPPLPLMSRVQRWSDSGVLRSPVTTLDGSAVCVRNNHNVLVWRPHQHSPSPPHLSPGPLHMRSISHQGTRVLETLQPSAGPSRASPPLAQFCNMHGAGERIRDSHLFFV
jgi:hypothetical protein